MNSMIVEIEQMFPQLFPSPANPFCKVFPYFLVFHNMGDSF